MRDIEEPVDAAGKKVEPIGYDKDPARRLLDPRRGGRARP